MMNFFSRESAPMGRNGCMKELLAKSEKEQGFKMTSIRKLLRRLWQGMRRLEAR